MTSLAVHPSGHVLTVGHTDGCISFWAVEDEDQPLLVRTVEDEDVNVVDGTKLEEILSQKSLNESKSITHVDAIREPIIKLSWSETPLTTGQWGGETALTVLGGTAGNAAGVNVLWLSVVNLPEAPASVAGQSGLHSTIRTALRTWLKGVKACFMPTTGVIQDFLLIPRDNPHFCGGFDPIAVLFLCDSGSNTRCTEAYQFPPSIFLRPQSDPTQSQFDIPTSHPYHIHTSSRLRLPHPLLNGADSIVGGQLVTLDNDVYENIVAKVEAADCDFPLTAGLAWTNDEHLSGARLSKVHEF